MDSNLEDIMTPIHILKEGNLKRGLILQNIIQKYSVLDESPEINCDYESDVEDYDLDDDYNVKKRLKTQSTSVRKKLFSMPRLEKILPFTSTPIVTRSTLKKINSDVQLSPLKEIKDNNNNNMNIDKTPETTTNKNNQELRNFDNNKNELLSKQPIVVLTPLNKMNKQFIQISKTKFKLFNPTTTTNNKNNNNDKDNVTQSPPTTDTQSPVTSNHNGNNQQEPPPLTELLNDPLFDIFKISSSNNNKNNKIRISEVRSCVNDDTCKQQQNQQAIETITSTTTTTTTTMITTSVPAAEVVATSVEITNTKTKRVDKLKELFLTQTYKLPERIIVTDMKLSEERRLVLEKRKLKNIKIINDPLKMLFMRNKILK